MKPLLITGGGGFLGAWIARVLVQQGQRVRVLDRAPTPSRGFVAITAMQDDTATGKSPSAANLMEWTTGDVTDARALAQAASGCAGIIHLAALLTPDCQRDPVLGAQVNLIGTLHAFEAAKQHGIRRVVYASSAAVFGPGSGPHDSVHPQPVTQYGAFKLACEACARAYWLDAGIRSVGIRPSIVYGPGRETGLTADISLACRAAVAAQPYTIGFSGRQGFVYAEDVARAFAAAALRPVETDNAGARALSLVGLLVDVREVAQEIMTQGTGAAITVDGPPVPMAAGLADTAHAALLAPQPPTSIRDGIAQTLAWYRAQQRMV